MKNPEIVLQELGDLYEFYRQIKQFTIKETTSSDKSAQVDADAAARHRRASNYLA